MIRIEFFELDKKMGFILKNVHSYVLRWSGFLFIRRYVYVTLEAYQKTFISVMKPKDSFNFLLGLNVIRSMDQW